MTDSRLKINKRLAIILVGFLAALTFGYVFYKAATNSFTHDESYTYTRYVKLTFWNIITYHSSDVIPNNHILNTLLMKVFEILLGSSELALRLPNVLAYLVFLVFSIRWLKQFNNPWLLVTGFIALHVNPYLLDFFALARGYGLSISFMFLSFYFFYNYISSAKQKTLTLSFFFAALAVWSSFILLNYFMALLLVYNVYCLFSVAKTNHSFADKFRQLLIANKIPLLVTCLLAIVISKALMTISGDLFGPHSGFWDNTARTLIFCASNTRLGNYVDYVSEFAATILIASAILYLYDLHKTKYDFIKSPHILFLLLSVFSAWMTILQHLVLNVPFLENRTGLFFIVLFNINFVCLIHFIFSKGKALSLAIIPSALYTLYLFFTFVSFSTLHDNITWDYDAHTKEMLQVLGNDYKTNSPAKSQVSLGITWLFEPTINFYRETQHLGWLKEVNRDGYKGNFDYYYVKDDSAYLDSTKKIILKKFDSIQTVLARNTSEGSK